MDEHKPVKRPGWPEEQPSEWKPSWLEWGIIIALAVVVVLAAITLFGSQTANIFHNVSNME